MGSVSAVVSTIITKGTPVPVQPESPNAVRAANAPGWGLGLAKDVETIAKQFNKLHGVLSTTAPTIKQIISLQNTSISLTTTQGSILLDPTGPQIVLTSGTTGSLNQSKIVLDATVPSLTLFDQSGAAATTLTDIQENPLPITATTGGAPDVITVPGHTYVNGDTTHITGSTGDTAINGYRIVENVSGNNFSVTDQNGTPINGNGTYSGGGQSARYFAGLLANTIALGESFTNFRLRLFADGRLVINNASLTGSSVSGGGITSIGGTAPNVLTLTINNGLLTISGTGTETGQGAITIDGKMSAGAYNAGGTDGGTASFTAGPLVGHTFTFKDGLFIS